MINFTKIYLPILAILVISFQGWSQDCKKYYKDQLENGSKLIECDGNYTIEKTEDGAYILKYYYPETKAITQFITFKDSRLKTLHGKYEKKWDDGTIVESGVYADDKRVGQWTEGNSMGQYSNGLKQGQWKSFQNDTTLISIQHYKNDILDGEKVKYDSLGQIIETTLYNAAAPARKYLFTQQILPHPYTRSNFRTSMNALLLAAGLGTRLRPITDTVTKCLIPIHGKPLLAWWMDLLEQHGVRRVLVNIHHLPSQVRDFAAAYRGSVQISLVHEEELLGSAGTIYANLGAFFTARSNSSYSMPTT